MLEILDVEYGRNQTEKLEECVEERLKFKEDQLEEDDDFILAMKEINQRRTELKISQDKWLSI